MKILVTGFEPNDEGLNASELVVCSLRDHPPPLLRPWMHSLSFKIMPGNTTVLGEVIDKTLKVTAPNICIGLGQARGYNRIALERMAKNLRYFVTLDRAGNAPKGEPVVADAPAAYWGAWLDLDDVVATLMTRNIPARISNDCGTHLCNQAFYHFLHWRAIHRADMKVGFVHVPALPEQVIQGWSESPFMPREMTCQAIALIVTQQIQKLYSALNGV